MPPVPIDYDSSPDAPPLFLREDGIESGLIDKLQGLKYEYRRDITNRASLERNFREKFEALNRVRLTDAEFTRLLDEIVTPDVFTASKTLRTINSFTRDDGTQLNYSLVNLKDWCKNDFEQSPEIIEVGCWAHARRYFKEAVSSAALPATQVSAWIGDLYGIERHAKQAKLSEAACAELRQQRAQPILRKLQA